MMKKFTLLSLIFLLTLFNGNTFAQDHYSKVRIYLEKETLNQLAALGIDITEGTYRKNVFLETDLNTNLLGRLDEENIRYEVLVPDATKFYAERAASERNLIPERDINDLYPVPDHFELGSMAGFYTLEEAMAELDEMATLYPDLISMRLPISTDTLTHDGRMIYWVKISDNHGINEDEPEILYTGVHHAREPISVQSLIYYMWYLLENYESNPDIRFLVDQTEMYFVPVVNPDGYEYNHMSYPAGGGLWRKNRCDNGDGTFGVDVNRNYSYMWGFDDYGSTPITYGETYRGASPMSEPENRNLRQFCVEHEFQIALNYHSYSNLCLYAWGYQSELSADNDLMTDFARLMTEENNYVYGPANTTIYPSNGDSNDWMYGDTVVKNKIYAFIPEIGGSADGFWPAVSRIIPLCQENVFQSLMAARLLLNYAEVNSHSSMATNELNSSAAFNLKRIGLADGGSFTVSITPLDAYILSVGNPLTFSNLSLMEVVTDSILFDLDAAIEAGTLFRYLLSVNNGQFVISDTITRVFGVEMEIFSDDFEEMPYWISDQWGVTEDESHSPIRSMTDSPVGPYQNDANSAIILDTVIDLRGVNASFLRFWARWEIEAGYDYVQVFAADSADGTWMALTGKYTRPGTEYQAEGEPVYDGLQTQWVEEEINLSAWAESQIRIKFNLVSDHYQREDGFYFDDLSVSVVSTTTGTAEKYSIDFPVALSLYPNPANGIVNVDYQSAEIERLQLTLYSISGKLMRVVHLDNHKGSVTLSVGELTPGFYYVGLQTGNRILTAKKLVVR
ncbi:MAG: M14 family zinc carboxypeptidase [Bacteroidales bacterium]|nr:M14 family zinc carboxypeptidase [Bacteroidales bacterium]